MRSDSQNLGISNGPSGEDQKSGTWHNVASISLALPTKTPTPEQKSQELLVVRIGSPLRKNYCIVDINICLEVIH